MTVYVLGAGASAHVGYPLISNMSLKLLQWMKKHDSRFDYASRAKSLEESFGSLSNFEELLIKMTRCVEECPRDNSEGLGRRTQLKSDLFVLSCALREWFTEIQVNPACAYRSFCLDVVQPGDCIITFNYDVSLDRELRNADKWQVGDGYGFVIPGLPNKSPVKILKLHGSSNWLASLYTNMAGYGQTAPGFIFGPRPVISDQDMKFLNYDDHRDVSFRGGVSGLCPLIIPPTPSKNFFIDISGKEELKNFFDELWSQAREALKQSEHVVICGYSMPEVDHRARELLLSSIDKGSQISIVSGNNSSDEIANTFRQHGFLNAAPAKRRRFEDWVSTVPSSMRS